MRQLAPIILFVYNRPDHVIKTLDALVKNTLAAESQLFIYSDGAKSAADVERVEEVRGVISKCSGFKSINIVEQKKNMGLAASIIGGVTKAVNEFGRVIVLEDDIETSPYFLAYMNDALDFYALDKRVSSVSGCNYPADLRMLNNDTYFLRVPLCWGWATWEDSWACFEKNVNSVSSVPKELVDYVNFGGVQNFFSQAESNVSGKLNTWFIFWYLSLANNKNLTLFPKNSLVNNVGHDGTGENCGRSNIFKQDIYHNKIRVETIPVVENSYALNSHKLFFKSIQAPILKRSLSKVVRSIKKIFIHMPKLLKWM